MASNRLYCLCSQPYDPSKFMIQCDICKEWFHGSCVNLSEHQSLDIEKYHCPQCASVYGASIRKLRTNWHRHDHTDPDPHGKAVQTGTYMFIRELKSRHFPSFDESLLRLYGHQLTLSYVIENGFDKPIFVENKDGLDLKVPPATFTVNDIIEYLGDNYEIDVIDVNKQSNLKMTMGEWMSYLSIPVRDNVYNVISLEFSNTRMSPVVEPPNIVKHISWVNTFWPQFLPPECPYSKPNVQKYCLMGVADSYTDFHIDFGGTSVWYHILKGEKVFYMVKPTPANLSLYERWMSSSNQSETFFGDQVDVCYRVVIQQGQTFFIPTGWIHAVLTTQDSLVFGGNFLHSLNIPLQLQVNELENRIKTVEKFKFPYFQTSNWYAAKHILENLKDFIDKKLPCPDYLLSGAKALCSTLKNWTQEKDFVKKLDLIPETVNYSRLLKDIAKEIRHIEKQNNGNKPKVEREKRKSKRNKPGNYVEESPLTPLKLSISKLEKQAVKLENKLKVSIKRQQGGETLTATGNPGDGSSSNTEKVSPLRLSLLPLSSKQEINVVNVKTESKSLISLKSRKDTSIFDFIDSDEADLTANLVVDEKPKKPNNKGRPKSSKPHKKQPASPSKEPKVTKNKKKPIKLKLSFNGKPAAESGDIKGEADQVDPISSLCNGTIEDILKASGYNNNVTSQIAAAEGHRTTLPGLPSAANVTKSPDEPVQSTLDETVTVSATNDVSDQVPESIESGSPSIAVTEDQNIVQSESSRSNDELGGRASPSTREAIQGMLSIGSSAFQFTSSSSVADSSFVSGDNSSPLLPPSDYNSPKGNLSPYSSSPVPYNSNIFCRTNNRTSVGGGLIINERRKVHRPKKFIVDDFEEKMAKCPQDDEYVYPSLEYSDDEEDYIQNINQRRGDPKDSTWNPRAKVTFSCPKGERPIREGHKKEAIECGLAAAAAKLAHLPPAKRPYNRKKPLPPKPKEFDYEPSASANNPLKRQASVESMIKGNKRPKKGFATAKQRLGKILKIHKMLH